MWRSFRIRIRIVGEEGHIYLIYGIPDRGSRWYSERDSAAEDDVRVRRSLTGADAELRPGDYAL